MFSAFREPQSLMERIKWRIPGLPGKPRGLCIRRTMTCVKRLQSLTLCQILYMYNAISTCNCSLNVWIFYSHFYRCRNWGVKGINGLFKVTKWVNEFRTLTTASKLKVTLRVPRSGLPWWPSGWDSALSLQRAQVWSLVWEIRSHLPWAQPK